MRRARVLDGHGWTGPLVEVADRMGLDEAPRLLVSGDTKMPFACGVFAPTIVLPEECEGWSLERRQAVLLHELAHVRRRDLLGHMLGRVVCAAYWFHPLVWMAATRLRSESERACDDLALSCGTRATDYAEHLLDIVTSVRGDSTPVVALAMARRKEFEGRMLAILDPDLRRATPSRRQSVALAGSLALIACLVAAATPVARAVRVQQLPAVVQSPVQPQPQSQPQSQPLVQPRPQLRPQPHAQVSAQLKQDTTGDDRASLLAKVLRNDSSASLRRIAAWGLSEYDESQAGAEALVNALGHDHDASVRDMAAWALGTMASGRNGDVDALSAASRTDTDRHVRETAVWALGTIASEHAIPALNEALKDPDEEIRSRAAWAIGTISPDRAPAGLTALLSDSNAETRKVAAWALYQIHDPATVPAIEAAFKKETDAENQIADIRALAAGGGDASVGVLSELLQSSDPRIKSIAVRALAGREASGPWPWPMPEPRPNP